MFDLTAGVYFYFYSIVYRLSLSCVSQTSIRTLSLIIFLPDPSILCRPRYPNLSQFALLLLSPIHSHQVLLLKTASLHVSCFILSLQLSRVSTFFAGTILVLLFLSKLYHSSYLSIFVLFLPAVICTISSCFTDFVFPSHISPAYGSFGTSTFIRVPLLPLGSRNEFC